LSDFLLMMLMLVSSMTARIVDEDGLPVPGASIFDADGILLGIAGSSGVCLLDVCQGDTVSVSGVGQTPWEGALPPDGIIRLSPDPSACSVVITVPGRRPGVRDRVPATSTLGPEELREVSGGGISGLLETVPGIMVRQYGGASPVVSISVRGADPSQTAWLVDGHSLSSASDGSPAGLLDPILFGSMQFSRGGTTAIPGGGMSGTVDLIPEDASAPPTLDLLAEDSGGRRAASGFGIGGIARISASTARIVSEQGSTGTSSSLLFSSRFPSISAGALFSSSEGGVDPPDWSPGTDAERSRTSADLWLRGDPGPIEARAGIHAGRMLYHSSYPESADDSHGEGRAEAGAALPTRWGGADIQLDANSQLEWISSTSAGDRSRSSGKLSVTFSAPWPGLNAVAGLDACKGCGTQPFGRLVESVSLLDQTLEISIQASRNFRRPTFNDLYWPHDDYAEGNPGLGPEEGLEGELAASLRTQEFDVWCSAFAGRTWDLIVWLPGQGGIWRPVNVSKVARRGLEAGLRMELLPVSLWASGSAILTLDDDGGSIDEGCILPYRPVLAGGGGASVASGRLALSLDASGAGRRFINASNTISLPAYMTAGAAVSLSAGRDPTVVVTASCSNIFDVYHEESNGYPGRGRTFRLELAMEGAGR